MRKTAVFLLLLSVFFGASVALHAQSRPRRVGSAGNAQPDDPVQSSPARPPVLSGPRSDGRQSPVSQAPTSQKNGPEEVAAGDVIHVNTTLVTVPVSVMDRDGKYVPNLRKEDFHIYEDNVEQQISYFGSVEKPFTVVLMLDTSGSTHFKLEEIQDGAIAFVNQLRPDDSVMVVSFDDRIRVLSEPTSDRSALRDAIRRSRSGEGTRLYDAVDMVINQRLSRISGRKAVVLFTDGVDTTSRNATFESTVRDAEEVDALIYTVDFDTYEDVNSRGGSSWPSRRQRSVMDWPFPFPFPFPGGGRGGRGGGGGGGAGSSREEYERADAYLHDLSEKTGARFYRADTMQNMEQAFALVAEELRRQYSIGYYPKIAGQAGQRRQLRVRVNRPNLAVKARDSYISEPNGNNTAQTTRSGRQSSPFATSPP